MSSSALLADNVAARAMRKAVRRLRGLLALARLAKCAELRRVCLRAAHLQLERLRVAVADAEGELVRRAGPAQRTIGGVDGGQRA